MMDEKQAEFFAEVIHATQVNHMALNEITKMLAILIAEATATSPSRQLELLSARIHDRANALRPSPESPDLEEFFPEIPDYMHRFADQLLQEKLR